MRIVNIVGGLGNQMFEYAVYLALKHHHSNEPIKLCTRSCCGYSLHNGFELQRIFNLEFQEASLWDLAKVAYPFFNYRSWQIMHHMLPHRRSMAVESFRLPFDDKDIRREGSVFYDGYWQNENYFKDLRSQICEAYRFPDLSDSRDKALAERLMHVNAVSCHVRRGDYLQNPIMGVCSHGYYQRAIERMNEMAQPNLYCVFSDDIAWCRKVLPSIIGDRDVVYVDWNKGLNAFRDMQLMSLCQHNIIANSSFSWWGAWLNCNENKIVMAPQRWMNIDMQNDPICDDWIRI